MRTLFVLCALAVLAPAVSAAESDPELEAMIRTYAQPEPSLGVYHDLRPTGRDYRAPAEPRRSPPRAVTIQTNHVVGQVYVLDGAGLTARQTGLPSPPCPTDGIGYAFDEDGATTRVLNAVGDKYEQIMYWEDFPTTLCAFGAFAFWRSIQYKVHGLGTPYNPIPGQKLAGYMNMSDIHQYPDNPNGPRSQFFMDTIGQETEHEYGMFLRFMKDGQPSADLVGRQNAHWSWFVNTNGSVMEGSKFFDKGDGTFGTVDPLGGYCSLDLYMWGLLPKEQVNDIWYVDQYRLVDPPNEAAFRMTGFCTDRQTYARINDCPAFAGATVGGSKRVVRIGDVVAALGERDPGYNTGAPHYVTQVFVLTGLPGQPLQRYDRTESYRRAWEEYFYTRSRFRGRAITTIPAAGEMPYDDLPYWEFGTPDDSWRGDSNIANLQLELAPTEPVTDPKAHPGTLSGTVQAAGATLTAPQAPPYAIKIDTTLYDAVKIVMRVEPSPGQNPPTRGRVKWNGGQNGVTFWLLPPESQTGWYTYSADLRDAEGWTGVVSGLQVEPLDGPGKFVIDSIKLLNLGTEWARQPEPENLAGATVNAIWGDATSDLYAVGTLKNGDPALMSGDGKSWTKEATDTPGGTAMSAVWGFGPLDVYAVGKSGIVAARCDENTCGAPRGTFAWVTGGGRQRIAGDSPDMYGLWGRSHDDMFAVGQGGRIYAGGAGNFGGWVQVGPGGPDLYAVWGNASEVFVVGDGGTILHSTDGSSFSPMSSGVTTALRGVRGASAGNRKVVWAVGDGGVVLRYDGQVWTKEDLSKLQLQQGISFRSVWARSPDEAYVVGDGGVILRWEGKELTERDLTVHPPRWVRHSSGTVNVLRTVFGVGELHVFAGGDVALFTHYQLSDLNKDSDRDGFVEGLDNCPHIANPGQEDGNDDGIGDACDDYDHDGVPNGIDNCPFLSNSRQIDTNHNGIGDACERTSSGCAVAPGAQAAGGAVALLFLTVLAGSRRWRARR